MSIDKQIKHYRMQKGMSQEQFAEKTFTTKSTISKWESGKMTPSIETIKVISTVLDVSFYKLIGKKEPLSKKLMNYLGKLFIWLFIWSHIDITIGATIGIMGIAFGVSSVVASFGGGIALMVMYSINDVWTQLRVVYIIIMFLSFPVLFIAFGSISFVFLKATEYLYLFSLKFFWRVNTNKYNKFHFYKLNKKWKIIIAVATSVSLIIVAVFVIYLGVSNSFEGLNTR